MSHRYVGRDFSEEELAAIRGLCADPTYPTRASISRAVCHGLGWKRPDGHLKDMSARVALARMERDGLIALPAPTRAQPLPRRHLVPTIEEGPELRCPLPDLGPIELFVVAGRRDSLRWNEMVGRFHYLGYTRLAGAQLRYLATAGGQLIAALGFGAAAWALAPRDTFIGWSPEARRSQLHLVVGHPRFLILPWVKVPHLASHLLGAVTRRLGGDWIARYGYAPVLVETFVEVGRHRGTCYRAANWARVGTTKGRGKLDRANARALPVKDIYLYPLDRGFRAKLGAG
ncbi:MAG: Druantia anti-phage system protein DruA [Acidimicrobiales bacterium]